MLAPIPEFPQRLVYLGTPSMAVPPLKTLVSAGFDVALVVSRVDKRRGRGSDLSPSPVKAAALELGLPVSHSVDDALDVGAELAVVVAFGQLIKPHVLAVLPMVNIHFSLLPRWRGAAPVERAILAGDQVTGTCLMQVDIGLDTGAVFDRVEVRVGSSSADELRNSLVQAGSAQLVRCLRSGLRDPQPQVGVPTTASKLTSDDFALDWNHSAVQLHRVVRLGAAWTTFRGRRLKVLGASVVDNELVLERVQPEGKGPMSYADWRNGVRWTTVDRLGS